MVSSKSRSSKTTRTSAKKGSARSSRASGRKAKAAPGRKPARAAARRSAKPAPRPAARHGAKAKTRAQAGKKKSAAKAAPAKVLARPKGVLAPPARKSAPGAPQKKLAGGALTPGVVPAKKVLAVVAARERPRKQVFRIEAPRHKVAQSTFGAADLAVFRRMLEEKRQELHDLYSAELRHSQETNEDGTEDIVDRANNAYSRELSFHISDGERQLLEEVDSAIARIDAGSYGICLHSGRPIPTERLKAVPWARYCIESQELFEKGLLD